MKDVVAWINARDYFYNNDRDIIESCFILNFGFNDELPYPQIMLYLDSISPLLVPGTGNLNGDWGMNLPSSCSVVIISGKYLDIIDQVNGSHAIGCILGHRLKIKVKDTKY